MSVDMTIQPMPWDEAYRIPRMTAAEAKASVLAEMGQAPVDEPAAPEERHHVSWETYNALRQMLAREQAEKEQLRHELAITAADRDHWYTQANHNDIELQTFARRRAALPAELRRQDAEAQHTHHVAHAA